MTALVTRITADDFLTSDHRGFELVDGEIRENPMSDLTSFLGGEMFRGIANHAVEHDLGRAYPQDTGIRVWDDAPNRVRKPDAMFIVKSRLRPPGDGWVRVAPDLVVEIVSPNDEAQELERKIANYRSAGVRLIWVIYPDTQNAYVHRRRQPVEVVEADGILDGEDVLPGFALPLRDLFALAQGAR